MMRSTLTPKPRKKRRALNRKRRQELRFVRPRRQSARRCGAAFAKPRPPRKRRAALGLAMSLDFAMSLDLAMNWGLDERSRKPATPSMRKRSTHLATILGVVWKARAAAAFARPPSIPLPAIAYRSFGVRDAFSCMSIRFSANHRGLATSATAQTEWTTS